MDQGVGRERRKQVGENVLVRVFGNCPNYCLEESGSLREHLLWSEYGLGGGHNEDEKGLLLRAGNL